MRLLSKFKSYITSFTQKIAHSVSQSEVKSTSDRLGPGEFFLKYAAKAFQFFVRRRKYDLKWKEFMVFTFVMQVPLGYWLRYTRVVKKWGATMVLLLHTAFGIILAMPLFMVYMFMGNYSRKSYIKFWACVPIMKGLAYSIALHATFIQIMDLTISGIALLYLREMFSRDIPWVACLFDYADPDCMGTYHDKEHKEVCCSEFMPNCSLTIQLKHSAKYSALDYYWEYILGLDYNQMAQYSGLNLSLAFSVLFLWLLIFILMLMGLRRFRGIMTGINRIIFIIMLPVAGITMYLAPSYATVSDIHSNFTNLLDYQFWIETIISGMHRELPGDVITFSAISSPGLTTTVDTLTIYVMKILFITMLTVWLSIGVTLIQKYYQISDSRCIPIEGDILIFAILPDIISRWIMPQFWLIIYFSVIFYWGFSTSVYVYNSFLEALLEEFPILIKWKVLISALFCLTIGSLHVLYLKPEFMVLFRHIIDTTMVQIKAAIVLLSLIGLFLYTVGKVKADYHFTYGVFLPPFWTGAVKIGILFISGMCTISLIIKWEYDDYKYILLFILLPVPIGIIITTILFLKKKIHTLLEPDPSWGPPSFKMRQARARFDPTYNIRHTGMIDTCRHACLKELRSVKTELRHWNSEKTRYEHIYENVFHEE